MIALTSGPCGYGSEVSGVGELLMLSIFTHTVGESFSNRPLSSAGGSLRPLALSFAGSPGMSIRSTSATPCCTVGNAATVVLRLSINLDHLDGSLPSKVGTPLTPLKSRVWRFLVMSSSGVSGRAGGGAGGAIA